MRNLSAQDFIDAWQPQSEERVPVRLDYRALSERIKRGEIVFFLGAEIAELCETAVYDNAMLVTRLAEQASYDDFAGSLSMIAEYYQRWSL